MTTTGRYCYLGGDSIHTGMYVALIKRLEREGLVVDLASRVKLSLNPAKSWAAWRGRDRLGPNAIEAVRGQIRGRVHLLPMWSPVPGFSLPFLSRAVGGCRRDSPIILHTRQLSMARLALAFKRLCPGVRVVGELEGDGVAEANYKYALIPNPTPSQQWRHALEQRFYSHQLGRLILASDAVVCVSHKLKQVLIRRYNLTPEQAACIRVFPSVASRERFSFRPEARERKRHALGLSDRFIVTYNGSLYGRWQVPDKLVEVFRLIRERRSDAVFLVLAPEDHWRYILPYLEAARLPQDAYRLQACPHEQVVDFLCAADVGLLLRDRHPMNEAAAPGKFAEYVLSGLPIIMTEGIGDFSEAAQGVECACVLPGLDDLAASRERINGFCSTEFTLEQRASFSGWGAERFAIELYVPQLAALYRALAGEVHRAVPK